MHIGGSRTLTLRSSRLVMPDRIRGRRHGAATAAVAVVACLLVGAGCSADEGKGVATTSTGLAAPKPAPARPDGPVAELTPIEAAGSPFIGSAVGVDVPDGYRQTEYIASGEATGYDAPDPLPADGEWTFRPEGSAAYRTRVLVRRPEDPGAFSGTVVVEWLNVSAGLDANPEYASFEEEIVRRGDAWVGVSAQLIGVNGGPVLVPVPGVDAFTGKGLRSIDPVRYGTLDHPGDGYAFDIFTQVARAVRDVDIAGATVDQMLAAGESQSAIALTTYYNGVQPLTRTFDGLFIHSRAFAALPVVGPGEMADLAGSMAKVPHAVVLRGDLATPALELQSEADVTGVLRSIEARQSDSDTFRLWEVAGTAHADQHLLGPMADLLDCGSPVNSGPMHLVAKAGYAALKTWAAGGDAPPTAPRLATDEAGGATPTQRRNAAGVGEGGIRTPPVEVPVEVLSGAPGPNSSLICQLMGSTTPIPPEQLATMYASAADYQRRFDAAVEATVDAGFLLAEDRAAMAAFASPERLG